MMVEQGKHESIFGDSIVKSQNNANGNADITWGDPTWVDGGTSIKVWIKSSVTSRRIANYWIRKYDTVRPLNCDKGGQYECGY